jgi:2',3'-cyclic-nucleotide 2'-phosphodiesterase (5'-nucleotidase family)
LSFKNYQINYSGSTAIPISSYSLTIPTNANYNIAVYNGSTVSQTFASTATYRFNGGVTFTVPTLRYANINVKRMLVNATTITFLTGTLY